MYCAIIKIDVCGSKSYVHSSRCLDPQDMRSILFSKIAELAKEVFPNADQEYPDGSMYSGQGDCIYMAMPDPDQALRATVDFQKRWYEIVSDYPDCRAVADYDDIIISSAISRTEALSEALENVNIIEKDAIAGEILVTRTLYEVLKSKGSYRFTQSGSVEIKQRTIETFKLAYDNPRTIEDDYLVQTLFMEDAKSGLLRERAVGMLAINYLIAKGGELSVESVINHIQQQERVGMEDQSIKRIIQENSMLETTAGIVKLKSSMVTTIEKIKADYAKEKDDCTDIVADEIARAMGIERGYLCQAIDLPGMIEKYLISVFGEIRMVSSYYGEANAFYSRLAEMSDFDSSLKKEFEVIRRLTKEEFSLFKMSFLASLTKVTAKANKYISSIFHNVLTNYYLNRNDKYVTNLLQKLKARDYFIDTNILYTYLVKSSQYNSIAQFVINKLIAFKANVCIYDKSVQEYNDSLNVALATYNRDSFRIRNSSYLQWITHEFIANPEHYAHDFDYCVKRHKIEIKENYGETRKALMRKHSFDLRKLEPYLDRKQLGDLYSVVSRAKSMNVSDEALAMRNPDSFEAKVIHDANCIVSLQDDASNPLDAPKLFITCDYRLASIRKLKGIRANFIVTIDEIYEILLPYLLIDENIVRNPVTVPNMLLASAIDVEMGNTDNFENAVGNYLKSATVPQNYKLLCGVKQQKRFQKIAHELEETRRQDDMEGYSRAKQQFEVAKNEYKREVGEQLAKSLTGKLLAEKAEKIVTLSEENALLRKEVDVGKRKVAGKKKYDKDIKRPVKKSPRKKRKNGKRR